MKNIELNAEQTWLVISNQQFLKSKERAILGITGYTPLAQDFFIKKETEKAILVNAVCQSSKRNSQGNFEHIEKTCWLPKDYILIINGKEEEYDEDGNEQIIERKIICVANWLFSKNKSELCYQ